MKTLFIGLAIAAIATATTINLPTPVSVPGGDIPGEIYNTNPNPGCQGVLCSYLAAYYLPVPGGDTVGEEGAYDQQPAYTYASSGGCYIGNGCVGSGPAKTHGSETPEPVSGMLMAAGLIGVGLLGRRR